METAEQIVLAVELSESLPWAEICARYPDQYVCLVDVLKIEPHSPTAMSRDLLNLGGGRGGDHYAAFVRGATAVVEFS